MLKYFKIFVRDLSYIISNYIISNIPCWHVRYILYKMMGMKIGKGSRINMKCIIMSPWKITIGKNTMINEFALLDGRGELIIGNNSSISMWAVIYTASHLSNSNEFAYYAKKTVIEDCCWIGTRAIVMPGSYIRKGTIIAVNSSIKGETEEKCVYMGIPAKKIKKRSISESYILENINYFK